VIRDDHILESGRDTLGWAIYIFRLRRALFSSGTSMGLIGDKGDQ
jgi:hypothetical protein